MLEYFVWNQTVNRTCRQNTEEEQTSKALVRWKKWTCKAISEHSTCTWFYSLWISSSMLPKVFKKCFNWKEEEEGTIKKDKDDRPQRQLRSGERAKQIFPAIYVLQIRWRKKNLEWGKFQSTWKYSQNAFAIRWSWKADNKCLERKQQ